MATSSRIRHAHDRDISLIVPLVRQYWEFEHIEGFDPTRIASLLAGFLAQSSQGRIWVAESDGQLSAYLLVTLVFSLEHGGVMAEIDEFFVLPTQRAAGLGARLLRQAETELAAMSVVRLQLQLGRENAKARAFYHRHGFMERNGYELLDKPLSSAIRPRSPCN
jgi:GNAT superfamily N-acetyltransferase